MPQKAVSTRFRFFPFSELLFDRRSYYAEIIILLFASFAYKFRVVISCKHNDLNNC